MTVSRQVALLSAILAIGLLARVAVRMILNGPIEIFEYQEIVDNLLAGRGFLLTYHGAPYRSIGSPPFPLANALVYWVSGSSPVAMLIVQSVFSALTAGACYWIASQLFSPAAGLVAGALSIFHPAFLLYDTHKIHPLSFDAALAALSVAFTIALSTRPSLGLVAIAALVQGVTVLERSTFVGLIPLALGALWMSTWRQQSPRTEASVGLTSRMTVYVLVIAAVFTPWIVRNIRVYSAFVPVSTISSELLWRGNNPRASGGAFAEGPGNVPMFDAAPPELKASVYGKDELAQSRAFGDAARRFIVAQPVAAAGLYLKKLSTFWWFSSQSGALYPARYLPAYQAYYLLMMMLACTGIWTVVGAHDARRRWWLAGMMVFMVSVGLLQAVFYVEVRHRWGIEPLLLVLSAGGVCRVMRSLSASRYALALSSVPHQ